MSEMSTIPIALQSSPDVLLTQCLRMDQLRAQAAPLLDTISRLEIRLREQHEGAMQYQVELYNMLDGATAISEVDVLLKDRFRDVREQLQRTQKSLAATFERLLDMRAKLASLSLEQEEGCLIREIRALLVLDSTDPQQSSQPSQAASKDYSQNPEPSSDPPELQAYYEAAGWVSIWKERIEDLRFRHAEEVGRRSGQPLQGGDGMEAAAQTFNEEEAQMLQRLQETREKTALFLQRCKDQGIEVPYELPPSVITSSAQSMLAIESYEEFASSPKEELPPERHAAVSQFVDSLSVGVDQSYFNIAERPPLFASGESPGEFEAASASPAIGGDDDVTVLANELEESGRGYDPGASSGGLSTHSQPPHLKELEATLQENPAFSGHADTQMILLQDTNMERALRPAMPIDLGKGMEELDSIDVRDPPRLIKTVRWQENQKTYVDVHDSTNSLKLLIQTSPPESITDPELLVRGVFVRGKLLATEGETEWLFENYHRRQNPSAYFVVGRVFFILWAEPAEDQSMKGSEVVEQADRHGARLFSKVRRFVVVRQGDGYCSCLPINTYDYHGVAKRGVKKSDHCIVYTSASPPTPLAAESPCRDEAGMLEEPIRVMVDDPTDKLAPSSRLNYGAVYTIDHKMKVRNFGKIRTTDIATLQDHFERVWSRSATDSQSTFSEMSSKDWSLVEYTPSSRSATLRDLEGLDAHEMAAVDHLEGRGFERSEALAAVRMAAPNTQVSPTRP